MVFQAQGESPTSCAGELGRNPAARMLQHIVQKKHSFNHRIGLGSRPRLPRRGRHRLPNTTYGRPPDTGGCFLIDQQQLRFVFVFGGKHLCLASNTD
eukprot:scaffold23427_cov68-Phaeocystis_antarctica.AAC.10